MADTLKPNKKYGHLYAIIRYESDADPMTPINLQVTVKKVVSDPHYAAREVERLNELNNEKGSLYFYQITRFEEAPVELLDAAPLRSGAAEAPQG
ncbi:MAG TPA: hypothetical protein DDY78_28255 [Planctomycetales bacterium]|jgi:hypothetical protein|nr:hypothetical protein [Planctomycetales bacterium]